MDPKPPEGSPPTSASPTARSASKRRTPGTQTTRPPRARLSPRALVREELGLAAELAAVTGLAVVQPVLGPFGDSPETFVAFGAQSGDIVRFGLLVAFVPLLVIWALTAATRAFGSHVRSSAQSIVVGALAALALGSLLGSSGPSGTWRALLCAAVALVVASLHQQFEPGRLFLRYAAPLPVFVLLSFLFASPVAPLVRPEAPPSPVSDGKAFDGPPVVVVVLDELPTLSIVDRDGNIDEELVPNLARLADTSTWYRDHTSASTATGTSLPVLLTGKLPEDPLNVPPPNDSEFPGNLIERMSERYEVHGMEWATSFCSTEQCPRRGELGAAASALLRSTGSGSPLGSLLGEGRSLWWSKVWPLADPYESGFRFGGADDAADQRRRTLEFIDGLDQPSGDAPIFDYLHTALPHQPWDLLPSGQAYNGPEAPHGGEFLLTWPDGDPGRDLAHAARSQHLLQVQFADRILGAVIDRLQELDRWDDALVVVTSDHGVSFQAGTQLRTLRSGNEIDLAWTPLFVKLPQQRDGAVDDSPVTALDVLPTILDVAGLDADDELPGRSLAEPGDPTTPRPFIVPPEYEGGSELSSGVVELDADGLGAIRSGGETSGYFQREPGDPLAAWRHGRHAGLLGQRTDEVGVCTEAGPPVSASVPDDWARYLSGGASQTSTLPLWHAGTVDSGDRVDVAVAVDGVVAGWSPSIPDGAQQRFGVLLAEPLTARAKGNPELFQVVDQPGCRLRPLAAG